MAAWWRIAALVVLAAAAAGAIAVLTARPAPDHSWFSTARPGPLVIAHRGGAGLRPENTLAAFSHAAALGADVVEMDVQATADGTLVCIHDATVDRTTNGRGRVDSLSLKDLHELDAGHSWSGDGGRSFPFRGKSIRVPTLEEVLSAFPETRMIIEIKHPGAALAQPLCSLIRRHAMPQRRLVASMSEDAVAAFRSACPEIATAMTRSDARTFFSLHLLRLERAYSPPVRALLIPDRLRGETLPTPRLIEAAHRRKLSVHVWTINDEGRMRNLLQAKVDGIITDRPDTLLRLLGRH
jgi:glycerophosphoryl diester phosphodiesterase